MSQNYLNNIQDNIHIFGINPSSPPYNLPELSEVLLARSLEGIVVFWDQSRSIAGDFNAKIPAPNGASDVLYLLDELKTSYGLVDPFFELNVVKDEQGFTDHRGELPETRVIILQHVCRFDGNLVDVLGSRFVATLNYNNELIQMNSSFRTVECHSPDNIFTELVIHSMYPGIQTNIELKLLPANSVTSIQTDIYVYQFATSSFSYEVRADNGQIINKYSITRHAHGYDRKISERNGALKCEGSHLSAPLNDPPTNTAVCSANSSWRSAYESLYWPLLPWKFGVGFAAWGSASHNSIKVKYQTINLPSTPSVEDYGAYKGEYIRLSRYPQNSFYHTREVDSHSQALPGLGGVVDLLSHEVGHGFIHQSLIRIHKLNSSQYGEGAKLISGYIIGAAITEGLADSIGKLSEAEALYSLHCNYNSPLPSCGSHSSIPCGGKRCLRGEYCSSAGSGASECKPCRVDCSEEAVIDGKFAYKYHDTKEEVFLNGKFYRKLNEPILWKITCPQSNSADEMQLYQNSIFLSGLLGSYNFAVDRITKKEGYIRHSYDIAFGTYLYHKMLLKLPEKPSAYEVQRIFASSFTTILSMVPDSSWNSSKINRASGMILFSPPFSWGGIPSQCTGTGCSSSSRYICERP